MSARCRRGAAPRPSRRWSLSAALAVASVAAGFASPVSAEPGLTVAAAMSLRDAMPKLVREFKSKGIPMTVTYGASGKLRRQVEAGAPIDVVIFAGAHDVDLLVERGLAVAASRRVVATNSLVLIGPSAAAPLTFQSIDQVPAGEMVAIGEPDSVPAGRYARDALVALGVWDGLQGRLVYGGHVAAVLQYARRGEVAAAVVYATDAAGVDDIVVLDRAGGAWAPRVETVAAAVAEGDQTSASAFIEFLASEPGSRIFAAHGFGPAETSVAEATP